MLKKDDREKTIYETIIERGFSRRDFLKMCATLAATMGLNFTDTSKVAKAMESSKRVPVIWLQFQDCTGCTESFIRSSHPKVESLIFDLVSLEYTEALSAASGHQVEAAREEVIKNYPGEYIVAVEGSIPKLDEYVMIGGKSGKQTLLETVKNAKAIIAYGSCSAWGGIPAAGPNPTGAMPVTDIVKHKPVLLVPGCPPIGEVMTGVIAHIVTFGTLPEIDSKGRPKAFYRHRIHDKCNRRAFFDAGLFAESFDDEGAKQGYCLYKVGCKGPTTYNSCAEMRWNGGTSYPIQSGNPCIGCSEKGFWDNGPFFERRAEIPGLQTTINPEKVGLTLTGVAAAGVAVHATLTGIKKNKDEKDNLRGE